MALVDYFLKIDGIPGESQDRKHKDEIEVESFSWSEAQTSASRHEADMGVGMHQISEFSCAMRANKASPQLARACAFNEPFKKAVLTCRKAGTEQRDYLIYTFQDVRVSKYRTSGSPANDAIPMDEICISFTSIAIEYREQKADGSVGGKFLTQIDAKKGFGQTGGY